MLWENDRKIRAGIAIAIAYKAITRRHDLPYSKSLGAQINLTCIERHSTQHRNGQMRFGRRVDFIWDAPWQRIQINVLLQRISLPVQQIA